ncbi:hypothetical protein BU16DRAFT_558718 [Lophium mytilinum]|uniref:Uncharacterized protein n=1 Tax=Lophium mytilinum TaxID=390894 RepID=A0A6A6R2Z8_9PEZI|nr:hypothetical protein BU16DRAFT_558718 [Lophium mytilinum]
MDRFAKLAEDTAPGDVKMIGHFDFLKLPAESRNFIYGFAFGRGQLYVVVNWNHHFEGRRAQCFDPRDRTPTADISTSFSVNRQIREESVTRFYSVQRFRICEKWRSF